MTKFVADRYLIESWSRFHAIALLAGTGLAFWFHHSSPIGMLAFFSWISFVVSNRENWRPMSKWGGAANWVSSLRWMALIGLCVAGPGIGGGPIGVVALLILLSDGIDGYLARKYNQQSVFGEYLDKETDALYVLVLGMLLYFQEKVGLWIVGIGLMRYIYVVLLIWFKPADRPESRSRMGQVIAVILMASLIGACWLPVWGYMPALVISGILVSYSFAKSFWGLQRPLPLAASPEVAPDSPRISGEVNPPTPPKADVRKTENS